MFSSTQGKGTNGMQSGTWLAYLLLGVVAVSGYFLMVLSRTASILGSRERLAQHERLLKGTTARLEALGREVTLALESKTPTLQAHACACEERSRPLEPGTSEVVVIVDADGLARYVSPTVEQTLGYRREDGVGRNIFGPPMMHPHDTQRMRDAFAGLLKDPGADVTVDCRLRHIDGRWIPVRATARNLLSDPGVGGIVVNYHDVS